MLTICEISGESAKICDIGGEKIFFHRDGHEKVKLSQGWTQMKDRIKDVNAVHTYP